MCTSRLCSGSHGREKTHLNITDKTPRDNIVPKESSGELLKKV